MKRKCKPQWKSCKLRGKCESATQAVQYYKSHARVCSAQADRVDIAMCELGYVLDARATRSREETRGSDAVAWTFADTVDMLASV
mmetsp:Transcript_10706/g.29776  ORF Transcript_10706/g.29776 Transcript_10706/m.29776 type:complete len:85 (-) Transcript_10706:88-342(-)